MSKQPCTYYTIQQKAEGIYKEKGSKFLSFAFPVNNEEQVKEILQTCKHQYYDARHICYAYSLGFEKKTQKAHDAGEPSNTAGKPILNQLHVHQLSNILIVVVRYFGGTLLGVAGLIQAYRSAAEDVIRNAVIVPYIRSHQYRICCDYSLLNNVMTVIKKEKLHINEKKLNKECTIITEIPEEIAEKVLMDIQQHQAIRIEKIENFSTFTNNNSTHERKKPRFHQ